MPIIPFPRICRRSSQHPQHHRRRSARPIFHHLPTRPTPVPARRLFSGLTCYANAALSYYCYYRGGASATLAVRTEIVPRLLLTGTLMIGIVPFTLTWIVPVEEPLLHRNKTLANKKYPARYDLTPREYGDERGTEAERVRKEKEARERDQTLEQVRRWNRLNYIRVLFPAAGVISAWYLCW
ncbi:hypothetical protein PG990_014738 [Apiospora arundinis]